MVHKGIATLAATLVLCFMLLGQYDQQFYLLHFYEALIYVAIILMLFYFHERWAYMLGIVAPIGWLILSFASGAMAASWGQFVRLLQAPTPIWGSPLLGAIVTVLSVMMAGFCAYRWREEYGDSGKGISTFLVSLGIIVAYYGILVFWYWKSVALPSR